MALQHYIVLLLQLNLIYLIGFIINRYGWFDFIGLINYFMLLIIGLRQTFLPIFSAIILVYMYTFGATFNEY